MQLVDTYRAVQNFVTGGFIFLPALPLIAYSMIFKESTFTAKNYFDTGAVFRIRIRIPNGGLKRAKMK
jgi:hypothetical protein